MKERSFLQKMYKEKYLTLSFDVEEFDTPLDHGKNISLEEQFTVSEQGFRNVLELLDKYQVSSTIFVTANFALRFPELIKEVSKKHEIASHGFYHSSFKTVDLLQSRLTLEEIIQRPVKGYRMARMAFVDSKAIEEAGYSYNSSLHPTWIPGKYNNFFARKTPFFEGTVLQIPASVTPFVRFPLFWLSVKNFPFQWIRFATNRVLNAYGHANFYFHPWEFIDIRDVSKFGLPFFISKGSEGPMLEKLEKLIVWGKKKGVFITFEELYKKISR